MSKSSVIEQYLTHLDLDSSTAYRIIHTKNLADRLHDWFFVNRIYVNNVSELPEIQTTFLDTPHTLWVDADNSPVKKALLDSKFYKYESSQPVMVTELASLRFTAASEKYFVKKINPVLEMDTWVETLARAFPADQEGFQKLIEHYRKLALWKDMRFFLAYANGLPAATSMTIAKDDTVGLDWVATLPEFRGLGLGKLMSSYALQNVQDKKITHAVLMASKMGKSIYEDLGFRTVGLVDMYKRITDA